jgi:type VI secretion system secreted protein VgrG
LWTKGTGVLCPHPSGALAGGASADSGHRHGGGDCAGHTFTLTNAPFFSDNGEYLVTAAGYHLEENRYASGEGETIHRTDFTVIPSSVVPSGAEHGVAAHLRPADGESGGAEGESIWTDKYGR